MVMVNYSKEININKIFNFISDYGSAYFSIQDFFFFFFVYINVIITH